MNDVFNTLFEVSLRSLLVLETSRNRNITSDMIAAIDFITVYGKDFGIGDDNLHGDNSFKFSEFAVRRDNVNKAVRQLALDGFVTVTVKQNGFAYSINDVGIKYCTKFENEYAESFRTLARKTWEIVSLKSEREVIELINRRSVSSVKRSGIDG